jgi:hypothetical protein
MTPEEIWKADPQKQNWVERKRVGTTTLSNTEISERSKIMMTCGQRYLTDRVFIIAIRHSLNFRQYSIFGDNCQQFIKRFCQEIEVEFDPDASNIFRTATDIANPLRWSISSLCLFFVLDIVYNEGKFALATSVHAALAFLSMILLTFSHPRMFLLNVAHLPFNISHFIHLVVNAFVWLLWVLVGAVLCFSFERECDLVAVRIVNGDEVFDVWHPCNIFLRCAQMAISIVCLLGGIYHIHYSNYFIQE